jgi:hypothetical protein
VNGSGKAKLVQLEHRLPALAKPLTSGQSLRRSGDDKVPLKTALNGQAEVCIFVSGVTVYGWVSNSIAGV